MPIPNPSEIWWEHTLAGAAAPGVRALMDAEAAAGRAHRSLYELYADLEEKDGALYAALQTRTNALLGLGRAVHPAREAPGAERAAALVERALDALPRGEEFLHALLDGLAKGFAVVELVWERDAAGRVMPAEWIAHRQEHFAFDGRGRLRLLSPPFRPGDGGAAEAPPHALGRSTAPARAALAPPPRKFIALAFGRDARNPYGRGLCQRAFWPCWFKRANLRAWSVFNERHGAPTAVASYPPGTPEDERRALLEALDSLQTDAGVIVPDTIEVKLLDSPHRGDGGAFRSLVEWCNDEIARVVLGGTLTSGEGRRGGSLALGAVHDAVRLEYLQADARLLERVLTDTIARWTAELNGAAPDDLPRVAIDARPPEDLEQQARIDTALVRLGVPLPVGDFHKRYGRRPPRDREHALVFDDSNVFQYHVRFGILTVNELRERLHLPPVAGGDRPPRDLGAGPDGPGASREEYAPLEEDGDPEREAEAEARER